MTDKDISLARDFESRVKSSLLRLMGEKSCSIGEALISLYEGYVIDDIKVLKKDAWKLAVDRLNIDLKDEEKDTLYAFYKRGHDGPIGLTEIIRFRNILNPRKLSKPKLSSAIDSETIRGRKVEFTAPPSSEKLKYRDEQRSKSIRRDARNKKSTERRTQAMAGAINATESLGEHNLQNDPLLRDDQPRNAGSNDQLNQKTSRDPKANQNGSLRVSFININKMPTNSVDSRTAEKLEGDILFLAETNPRKHKPLSLVQIQGFQHFQNTGPGNGMGTAIRGTVQIQDVKEFSIDCNEDHFLINMVRAEGMNFAAAYSPPDITEEDFEEGLQKVVSLNPDIIMGDFNCLVRGYMSKSTCPKGSILEGLLSEAGYICLNRKNITTSKKGNTIKDYVWARQPWPINYFEVEKTDHFGITVTLNRKFHNRNKILRNKRLNEEQIADMDKKCQEAISKTRTSSELYQCWLKILRETYGSSPRNAKNISNELDKDLEALGVQHSQTDAS